MLAQPRYAVAPHIRSGARPARLTHHAGPQNAPHVRHAGVAFELCPTVNARHGSKNKVEAQHCNERPQPGSANGIICVQRMSCARACAIQRLQAATLTPHDQFQERRPARLHAFRKRRGASIANSVS